MTNQSNVPLALQAERLENVILEHLTRTTNTKLQELVTKLTANLDQAPSYDEVGRALRRLKTRGLAMYLTGRGCGWRRP